MIVFPCAKVNIGFNVTRQRLDGYHDIESLFIPTPLTDMLEVTLPQDEHSEQTVWAASGLALDCAADDNLCMRALRVMRNELDLPAVSLHLHKIIPTSAGLGGGSADATAVITTLNTLLDLGLTEPQMRLLAARVGADCPFFVGSRPALVGGVGDQIEPYACPQLTGKRIAIVKPPVPVSTTSAYQMVTPRPWRKPLREIVGQDIRTWREELSNDFEEPIFEVYPELPRIKEQLYAQGALYAQMSGSGSAMYALFDEASPGVAPAQFPGMFVFQGRL